MNEVENIFQIRKIRKPATESTSEFGRRTLVAYMNKERRRDITHFKVHL